MENIYEFTAFNSETLYGYGTETEARLYLNWLNKSREINLYEMTASDISDAEADLLAVNLCDMINDPEFLE